MAVSLVGVDAKIERAKEHVQNLSPEVSQFVRQHTYRGIFDYDSQTGEHYAILEVAEMPPARWAVIIGEIVHDLRSALDHLACQMALTNKRRNCNGVIFPIFPDVAEAKNEAEYRRVVKQFPIATHAVIDRLQPYKRGDLASEHPLDILRRMNNRDKHQLPILALGIFTIRDLAIRERDGGRKLTLPPEGSWRQLRIKLGTTRFNLRIPDIALDVNVYGELAPEVMLDEPSFSKTEPLIPFLQQMIDIVEGIVSALRPLI